MYSVCIIIGPTLLLVIMISVFVHVSDGFPKIKVLMGGGWVG